MAEQGFDVVVVGNVGIDTNVYAYGNDIDFSVEANFTQNIDYVGQAGGFASRGYAQLGKRTAFIGYVGADHNGQLVRAAFEQDGIDMRGVFIDPQGTSRSVNFMFVDGRRKNFYDGKGHMQLMPDLELCRSILRGAKLAHFHIPNWARLLLPIARELGVVIACDIQDVVRPDDPYRQDFVEYANILFCSAANHPDPQPLLDTLLRAKPSLTVVVGMGAAGCAVGTAVETRFFPPVTLPMPVVDTNGAGDGLAVGFLSSVILEQRELDAAVQRGQIVARYTCAQRATTDSLITTAQLDQFFQG